MHVNSDTIACFSTRIQKPNELACCVAYCNTFNGPTFWARVNLAMACPSSASCFSTRASRCRHISDAWQVQSHERKAWSVIGTHGPLCAHAEFPRASLSRLPAVKQRPCRRQNPTQHALGCPTLTFCCSCCKSRSRLCASDAKSCCRSDHVSTDH